VSSKWWGDGVRKKGEENNLNEAGTRGNCLTLSRSGAAGRIHAGLTGGHEA